MDKANALLSLGEIERAVNSLEAALSTEKVRPNVLTQAYIDLPVLIASEKIKARYKQALQILQEHRSRPKFPIERFLWNVAGAIIHRELGEIEIARKSANAALAAAGEDASGFRNHPQLGLVEDKFKSLRNELAQLAA